MKLIKTLGLLIFITGIFAQSFETEEKKSNLLENKSMDDSKKLQQYYSNVFSANKEKTSAMFNFEFGIDKEKYLEKLKEVLPLDGPVDGDKYMVGPNDLLSINVWGDLPISFNAPITPEGSVVLPQIGIIKIGNVTLNKAKEILAKELRKKFLKGEITSTLLLPRVFNVYVSGVVNSPGTFYASSVHRVDYALYMANAQNTQVVSQLQSKQLQNKEQINRPDYIQYFSDQIQKNPELEMSLRNIKIIRKTGDTLTADIIRFYATGDTKYNPYLNDGDRIVVNQLSMKRNNLSISGAVRLQGVYEYNKADSLKSVYEICQGATEFADLEEVNLFRFIASENKYNKQTLNLKNILSGKEKDFSLQPGDRIIVREKDRDTETFFATIKGEVERPGIYPVIKNKTTLKELVEMAGGFTKNAALNESKVIRFTEKLDKMQNNPDYERISSMRIGDMNKSDREYYNFESAVKRNVVAVDFNRVFNGNDDAQNIIIENDDLILVPVRQNTVYVYGQVPYTGYVNFVDGKKIDYYLTAAGGPVDMAEEGDIVVIKAGTKQWLDPDDTTIEPGDAIFVPRERETDAEYYFNWFSKIAATVGGVASVVATIILITKK